MLPTINQRTLDVSRKKSIRSPRRSVRLSGLTVRRAESFEDMRAVFRIRADAYGRQGYIDPREIEQLQDSYDLSSCATSHLACCHDVPVATVRTVIDSREYRLPMDEEGIGASLGFLRREGRRIAEICKLAVRKEYATQSLRLLFELQRVVYRHALQSGVDDIVIAVVPTHARYYSRVLLFDQISDVLRYETLGCDAVVMHLDLRTADKLCVGRAVAGIDFHEHFVLGGAESSNFPVVHNCPR
ncbi:MAG: hypothetical protein JXM70_08305 [Pirellulales bacterium]|nr:hypothetical protein [Pirellulales bacterium]